MSEEEGISNAIWVISRCLKYRFQASTNDVLAMCGSSLFCSDLLRVMDILYISIRTPVIWSIEQDNWEAINGSMG